VVVVVCVGLVWDDVCMYVCMYVCTKYVCVYVSMGWDGIGDGCGAVQPSKAPRLGGVAQLGKGLSYVRSCVH
jgi:hypothetical protein